MDALERAPIAGGARPSRRWLCIIALICVVALLVAGGWFAWARAHSTQYYGGPDTANDVLGQVTLGSTHNDVWVVGRRFDSLTGVSPLRDTFILHRETTGRWVVSEMLDATGGDFITAIAMVSSDEGWAVGGAGNGHALILHYQDGKWNSLPQDVAGQLDAIAMVSPDEGWAVGSVGGAATLMLHYSHGAWSSIIAPQVGVLDTISMYSADSGWAAGAGILRYANGAWTESAFTPPSGVTISQIVEPSPEEAWAVGDTIYHYQFGKWSVASVPSNASISGIAMSDPRDGWAVGDPSNTHTSVLWQYANGSWTALKSPTREPLLSVASISPREVWAVGMAGVIYDCGPWSCGLVNGPA